MCTYTRFDDASANFHNVERVIVTTGIGIGVNVGGILPGLREAAIVEVKVSLLELWVNARDYIVNRLENSVQDSMTTTSDDESRRPTQSPALPHGVDPSWYPA